MVAKRESDARAPVHPPEKHSDSVFGRPGKSEIPEQKLPVNGPSLNEEWCGKDAAMGQVTLRHVQLQVVARNQLMLHGGAGEVTVVAAQAHPLLLLSHAVDWE